MKRVTLVLRAELGQFKWEVVNSMCERHLGIAAIEMVEDVLTQGLFTIYLGFAPLINRGGA